MAIAALAVRDGLHPAAWSPLERSRSIGWRRGWRWRSLRAVLDFNYPARD